MSVYQPNDYLYVVIRLDLAGNDSRDHYRRRINLNQGGTSDGYGEKISCIILKRKEFYILLLKNKEKKGL